jgi:hypothetical protein
LFLKSVAFSLLQNLKDKQMKKIILGLLLGASLICEMIKLSLRLLVDQSVTPVLLTKKSGLKLEL